ncbi:MAG: Gfo/Idh/MocA family oxidoreductase [Candidatus Eisenbacteria sp.]|nr:Gfo/Idh/MocA family oxidoreductase [Candidatus Eisenbacteria bacterium]
MATLKIGIIGLGVGEQHIAGYRAHAHARVVVLCDIDAEKRDMARSRYPECKVVSQAAEVLRDPEIDVVSIASYDDCHAAEVLEALQEGKHVFVEKPLCLYPDEAKAIRSELKRRPNLSLSSNLILRKSPRFLYLREKIQAGDLGELFYLEGAYNYGRLRKLTHGWRGKIDLYSVVYGGGVHIIDLLLWLTGERIVEVSAFGNGIATRDTAFRHNDMVVAILRCESGVIGKISCNFGCVGPHFHELAVYGTEATFVNRLEGGFLTSSRDPDQVPEMIPGTHRSVPKGALITSFLDGILGLGTAEVTADDVFEAMSACFAIEQAVREPGKVAVEAF